jgi:cytochrome c-type biogenesis protein CcmH/NrfF
LWLGPVLLLLAGAVAVAGIVRKRTLPSLPPDDRQEW